jgi:two-component system, sensor histidine kinase and response regulator
MHSSLFSGNFRHIDPAVFDDIRKQMPGSPGIISRIIGSFLRLSPVMLEKLRTALLAGDTEAVRKAAHTMKSSNAQIGASHMAAICKKLELLESMDQVPDIGVFLQDMDREYQGVENELGEILVQSQGM